MKFHAKGGSDFEPVPAGNHLAVCNAIVDLGMQPGSAAFPEPKHQVYVRFELPGQRVDFEREGKKVNGPMSIGHRFTASMNKKANLRKFIESWFGKKFPSDEAAADFDLALLLDRCCLLNVVHNEGSERIYANIAGASPIPAGMPSKCKRENAVIFFDLAEPDDEMFQRMPEWLQTIISKRLPDAATGAAVKANGKPAAAATLAGYQRDPRIDRTESGLPTGNEPGTTFDDEIPF